LVSETVPEKLWGKEFIIVLSAGIISFSAFGMIAPIFPSFATGLGATLSVAGVIAGMIAVVALVGRPFASILGDRFNKKYLLAVALTLNGLSTILYSFTPNLIMLVPVRVIHGLMFSVGGAIVLALGVEYIPKNRMGEGIGFLSIGQVIGMAVGPNAGIFLAGRFSYQVCFLVSGIAIISAGLLICALRYKHVPPLSLDGSPKTPLRLQNLIAMELLPNAAFVSIFAMGTGLATSFLVIMGNERSIYGVGVYFFVNAFVVLVTRPYIGRLTDRKSPAFIIIPGYVLAAAAMIVIGAAHSLLALVIAAVLVALGTGSALPAFQTDCVQRLGRARSTVATGTYLIGMDIGMFIGPMFGGIMADTFGFCAAFSSVGVLMLLGSGVYVIHKKFLMKKEKILC